MQGDDVDADDLRRPAIDQCPILRTAAAPEVENAQPGDVSEQLLLRGTLGRPGIMLSRMRRGFLLVPAVTLALAGCSVSAPPDGPTSDAPTTSAVASSIPTPSDSRGSSAADIPFPLAPEPPQNVTVVPNAYIGVKQSGYVNYRVEVPSADTGPRQYATGSPIMEGSRVVAYKVAPGDIWDFICDRFNLSNDGYILVINSVRRGDVSLGDSGASLYAGDVVNLSAYTMHKYGSINGKVEHNPDLPLMPSQEP